MKSKKFNDFCRKIVDITRSNVNKYPEVNLLGRDCYIWEKCVIKSSPNNWNFKTRNELQFLEILNTKCKGNYYPKILDSTKIGNRFFLLIKYYQFPNLSNLLNNNIINRIKLTPNIIKGIEDAANKILANLKELEIIHRDIHPNNILLDKKGERIILIDFGFAIKKGGKISTKNNDEEILLKKSLIHLGGDYKMKNKKFSYETDRYSMNKIIRELKEISLWNKFIK